MFVQNSVRVLSLSLLPGTMQNRNPVLYLSSSQTDHISANSKACQTLERSFYQSTDGCFIASNKKEKHIHTSTQKAWQTSRWNPFAKIVNTGFKCANIQKSTPKYSHMQTTYYMYIICIIFKNCMIQEFYFLYLDFYPCILVNKHL